MNSCHWLRGHGMRPRASRRMSRRGALELLAVSLIIVTGGCASSTAKLQATKTVGIVSAIGDDFTLTRAGLIAPADAERHASIERWGLDDLVVARAGALLGPRFQVVTVTYPRASFAAPEQTSAFTLLNIEQPSALKLLNMKSRRDDQLSELVRGQVTPQGLDAYVVITKAPSTYGSRGRTVAGIGIIQNVAVFGSSS